MSEYQEALYCPKCGNKTAISVGGGFVEAGEWDGSRYEFEGNVDRYQCSNQDCGKEFYI
jgi:formate dehydrogenase maturation protein FdhE